jgi:hypothetical protein
LILCFGSRRRLPNPPAEIWSVRFAPNTEVFADLCVPRTSSALIKWLEAEHAVLAVCEGQRWLILDNRRMAIVDAADAIQYIPLLVIDHRGVRQYLKPDT